MIIDEALDIIVLKKNIRKIRRTDLGRPVSKYSFRDNGYYPQWSRIQHDYYDVCFTSERLLTYNFFINFYRYLSWIFSKTFKTFYLIIVLVVRWLVQNNNNNGVVTRLTFNIQKRRFRNDQFFSRRPGQCLLFCAIGFCRS